MEGQARKHPTLRFGVFDADFAAGELRRQGVRVKIQEQPFQVLAMLLERPGEVVTREELRQRLWPDGTFVDFDHGVNTAINKIREALDDDAENPRFVETLPRRGYRFIAPVATMSSSSSPIAPAPSPAESVAAISPSPTETAVRDRRYNKRLALAAGAALVALITTLLALNVAGLRERFVRRDARAPTEGLTITPFTTFPGFESGPSFSPDGNQIAFHWNGEQRDNWDIYVKVIGAEKPLRLTTCPEDDMWPAWSPDGRQIAFLRKTETACAIFLVPPVGGQERKLFDLEWKGSPGRQLLGQLSWSPDGKLLAVSNKPSEQEPFRIFLVSTETLETRPLTSPRGNIWGDRRLAFSPDGKAVAFARHSWGRLSNLMIQPLSAGEPRPLVSDPTFESSISGLAWTREGKDLLFTGLRLGTGQPRSRLWRIPVSGGSSEHVAGVDPSVHYPTVARRGERLALTRAIPHLDFWGGVWRLPGLKSTSPHSSPQPFLTSNESDYGPEFSPDGRKIAFISDRATGVHGDIWVCDSDGSNPMQLTSLPEHSGTPRWSPDGKKIVFDCQSGTQCDVFVVNAEGGVPRQLTHEPSFDAIASWSRDGEWIYFSSDRTGEFQIWKMPAQGGPTTQVTRGGGWGAFESLDGKYLYFSKRGRTIMDPGDGIWRMPVGGGEETRVLDRKVNCFNWKMAKEGIYFLSFTPIRGGEQWSIELFNPETGKVTQIFSQTSSATHIEGLTVSPDGQWILFHEMPPPEADIILVENFR